MSYIWAVATHRGLIRDANEDSVYPASGGAGEGPLLFAIADGMGGHAAGEVASRIAIDTVRDEESVGLVERVQLANERIADQAKTDPSTAGMGTTISAAVLSQEGSVEIAHVGDSRIYLLRDNELRQLTKDHTLVAQLVAEGRVTPEQAATHPQRSMLMRAVGHGRPLEVDVVEEPLQDGDRLMICSDGLSDMIDMKLMTELLAQGTVEEAVWALVEAANRAGGHDNTSVIAVDVTS